MKKTIVLFTVMAVTWVMASFSFSQYGADEERNRAPESVSCTYTCWYQTSDGHWYYINKPGLATDCNRVTYQSSCESSGCAPIPSC
jgi:hypothetical protein